jgi:hypothetical protein
VTQCYVEYSKAITRRYVAYREILLDTKFEKLRAMLHSAESRLRAMQVKINSLIPARNLNRIKKYFRVFIRALGAIDLWKKWRPKISWDCLFKKECLFHEIKISHQKIIALFPNLRCIVYTYRVPRLVAEKSHYYPIPLHSPVGGGRRGVLPLRPWRFASAIQDLFSFLRKKAFKFPGSGD